MNRQALDWEEISAKYIPDKESVLKYVKKY